MKKIIIVESNKFSTFDSNTMEALCTSGLGAEIAFSVFIKSENKGGIGRNLDSTQFRKFFDELNPTAQPCSAKIYITGGSTSEESVKSAESLKQALNDMQEEGYIFDIQMKVNGELHPDFIFFQGE